MNEKDLKKLKRVEMLEMLYEQQKQIEDLEKENKELKNYLRKKTIILKEVGSIANASLALTNIFEEAQKAADTYLKSIAEIYDNAKQGKLIKDLNLPQPTAQAKRGRHSK